ncbi:MAG: hypothetical protein ACLGI6_00035 [Gammaproteobacteria bacterium]
MADGTLGFHCTACGKCCNSPPAMSVPELLRHGERFIGSLAVARVRQLAAGSRIAAGDATEVLDEAQAAELAELQDALFHRAGPATYSLVAQAFDYPSLDRCPALATDGQCAVHGPDKPLMCRVVPLDPCLPDSLQHSVLRNRRASDAYLGADCISEREHSPYRPLVLQRRVADLDYASDLVRRRASLIEEKRSWGTAVFSVLAPELARSIQLDASGAGYLVLPLAPVLAVLAAQGDAQRAQCVQYIDRQLALIDSAIGAALARKNPADRPVTTQLRAFAQAYLRQRPLLARGLL